MSYLTLEEAWAEALRYADDHEQEFQRRNETFEQLDNGLYEKPEDHNHPVDEWEWSAHRHLCDEWWREKATTLLPSTN